MIMRRWRPVEDGYRDRTDAGRRLAELLAAFRDAEATVVLALPRGGVPVAFEVALALNLPLDVFVVRKLGAPGQPELAVGAIASGGVRVLNRDVVDALELGSEALAEITERERTELDRRERAYREGRGPLDVRDRTVILVDDGVATGATMLAAIDALRERRAAKIVVGVPVASPTVVRRLSEAADQVVCPFQPGLFFSVGAVYRDFDQVTDGEVRDLLTSAGRSTRTAAVEPSLPGGGGPGVDEA